MHFSQFLYVRNKRPFVLKSGSRKTDRVGIITNYYIMKKQEIKLGLKKFIVSNLSIDSVKGGTIGIESVDRLNCETEDCTQGCATLAYTNCYLCPHTTC